MPRFDLDNAEPFIENDEEEGRVIGFAVACEDGFIEVRSIPEWKEYNKDFPKALEQRAENYLRIFSFADRPDVEAEDPTLYRDLVRFFAEHIWFPDVRFYSVLAAWTICSWIQEYLTHATRLVFYGPTLSGKTRAINCLALVSYRCYNQIMPTGPVLFRMIEKYRVSICIDEKQGIQEERREDIDTLIKGGFEDGQSIARCNDKNTLDFFHIYGPVAIGTKRRPSEDIENRSVLICMTQKPSNDELGDSPIRRRIDRKAAASLRGRLLAFRLRVQAGKVPLRNFMETADARAQETLIIDGKEVLLNDRSIDKASELLVPCAMFDENDCDSILEIVAQSERDANQGLRDTLEASVFFALQTVLDEKRRAPSLDDEAKVDISAISSREVADQLNADLDAQGNASKDKRVHTRTVNSVLATLGFSFERGAHNLSYFSPKRFYEIYGRNAAKFGGRGLIDAA